MFVSGFVVGLFCGFALASMCWYLAQQSRPPEPVAILTFERPERRLERVNLN